MQQRTLRLQKNNRRILFRHAIVAEDDRIRRELRSPTRFIRIPLTRAMIEDEHRPAIFDKLQQPRVECDQLRMCLVTTIVDDDRLIPRKVRLRDVVDSQLRRVKTERRERTFQRRIAARYVTDFPAANDKRIGIDQLPIPSRDRLFRIRQIDADVHAQPLVWCADQQWTTYHEILRIGRAGGEIELTPCLETLADDSQQTSEIRREMVLWFDFDAEGL